MEGNKNLILSKAAPSSEFSLVLRSSVAFDGVNLPWSISLWKTGQILRTQESRFFFWSGAPIAHHSAWNKYKNIHKRVSGRVWHTVGTQEMLPQQWEYCRRGSFIFLTSI